MMVIRVTGLIMMVVITVMVTVVIGVMGMGW